MIVLALTRLHRVRIRHRDRSPRQHKAIRGKHDLHEIESTEFGALQGLLLQLRRNRRRHEGADLRRLPAPDAALAAEPNRLVRAKRSCAVDEAGKPPAVFRFS